MTFYLIILWIHTWKSKKGSKSVEKWLENENYHVPYLMASHRKHGIREPTSRFHQTPSQPAQQQPHLPHGLRALSTHGPGSGQLQPGRIPGLWPVSEPHADWQEEPQAPGPNEENLPSCRGPAWGPPPMAKVMRKEAWHTQRRDQASGNPLFPSI